MSDAPRILYCNCTYAQVVPKDVKENVLRQLCASGMAFDAVADLCEMSARRDPALKELARGRVKIAACFPRAVRWLFSAAGAPLDPRETEVRNMRVEAADVVVHQLLDDALSPNLPAGKAEPPAGIEAPALAVPTLNP